MAISPDILRALSEGITALFKGDDQDSDCAHRILRNMAVHEGICLVGDTWIPKEDVTFGYTPKGSGDGIFATEGLDGIWRTFGHDDPLEEGTPIYLDIQCCTLLRTTGPARSPITPKAAFQYREIEGSACKGPEDL